MNKFTTEPFPASRLFTMDIGQLGLRKHCVHSLIELDVTAARAHLREKKTKNPNTLSFTAWFLRCLAEAINEHPQVHALKGRGNQRVLFHEVDISLLVERKVEGEKVPLPVVLRNVNNKTVRELHAEIEAAKSQQVHNESSFVLGRRSSRFLMGVALAVPQPLRLLGWKLLLANPVRVKQMMGTVVVSSLGTAERVRGWAVPVTIHPLSVTLGSITRKPGVHKNEISIREYLPVTLLFDHDVVDGMPMMKFAARLTELIENPPTSL